MRGGPLRHKVTLQRVVNTRTTAGGYTQAWTDLGTGWAEIKPIRGREFLQADQMHADVSHMIRLRWNPEHTLTAADRITYGTRTFNIVQAVNADERDRMIEVMATEVVNG